MTKEPEKPSAPIQGKVAGVLTARALAINIGSSNGVKLGMKFKVLSDKPTEIHDPETNDLLGLIDQEKVRVKAVEVQEKLSVCKTYKTHRTGGSDFISFGSLFAPARTVPETLKAEDSALLPPLSEEESYVKRGDRVVQIFETDEE